MKLFTSSISASFEFLKVTRIDFQSFTISLDSVQIILFRFSILESRIESLSDHEHATPCSLAHLFLLLKFSNLLHLTPFKPTPRPTIGLFNFFRLWALLQLLFPELATIDSTKIFPHLGVSPYYYELICYTIHSISASR